jgi:hypothetical protein
VPRPLNLILPESACGLKKKRLIIRLGKEPLPRKPCRNPFHGMAPIAAALPLAPLWSQRDGASATNNPVEDLFSIFLKLPANFSGEQDV